MSENLITDSQLDRLTHVIYSFFPMNGATVGKMTDSLAVRKLDHLFSKKGDNVKIMFAVGGWANSQYFSDMAASSTTRSQFIRSVLALIREYGFDGVDLDWEYPVGGGGDKNGKRPEDKQNYVQLFKELRQALGSDKVISLASAASEETIKKGFDLQGIAKHSSM